MASENKKNAVDETLQFRKADAFEKELTQILDADQSENLDPAVIALIDTDNFMHVNTDFGHDVGDNVLIETGRHIQSCLPDGAEVFRISGDEFGVLFRCGMEKEDVFLLMEELRKSFDVRTPDGEPLTVSIGIASAFDDATRYHELVRKADSAMFRAKYAGRNRVALAREEKMIPKTSHYTGDQLKRLTALSKREGIGEAILLREALDTLLRKYDI